MAIITKTFDALNGTFYAWAESTDWEFLNGKGTEYELNWIKEYPDDPDSDTIAMQFIFDDDHAALAFKLKHGL